MALSSKTNERDTRTTNVCRLSATLEVLGTATYWHARHGMFVFVYVYVLVTFGDIWCQFVSFGPAPHIYQRGERVGGAVCTSKVPRRTRCYPSG